MGVLSSIIYLQNDCNLVTYIYDKRDSSRQICE